MMKRLRFVFLTLLIVGAGTCDIAAARPAHHHGRVRTHVGVYVGPAIGLNWYQPAPYAYSPYSYSPYSYSPYSPYYYPPYPAVVVVPQAPSTYIEQAPQYQAGQEQAAPNDWYYCKKPEGYYPYVKRCPGGWQRVPAQPQQ